MLKAAVDVAYVGETAKAVCLLFNHWHDEAASSIHTAFVSHVAAYEPGAFYKRELPCLLAVLQQVDLSLLDTIIIDGYVFLDNEGKKGLGAQLHEALALKVPVIGVAKTSFYQNRGALTVFRGESKSPLFVTAIGMDANDAAHCIQLMPGGHRMPALLQQLDRLTKEA